MRNCPICNNNGKRVILNDYCGTSMVNAEVASVCLFECTTCGHRYIDALNLSQAWFDEYYLNRYKTDDKPYSDARLNSLADFINTFTRNKDNVLDIGGTDGELQKLIKCNCVTVGVGDKIRGGYQLVVLSHTLEHIYDIPYMMERIKSNMLKKSLLVVEIPIHLYDNYQEPTKYDYHWQHVNKFRPRDIESLFVRNGFKIEVSEQLPDYREYNCWRIVGRNG